MEKKDGKNEMEEMIRDLMRIAQNLPEPVEMEYLEIDSDFIEVRNEVNNQLYQLLDSFSNNISESIKSEQFRFQLPQQVQDYIEEKFEEIDNILEKPKNTINPNLKDFGLINLKLKKPQLGFKQPVSNDNVPFQCRLRVKPNSIVPLESLTLKENASILDVTFNPYEYENKEWAKNSVKWLYSSKKQDISRPLEELKVMDPSDLEWVDKGEQLNKVVKLLKKEPVIAVDLENHSFRSFKGFVCLMQISTRERDFLIDTIALRSEMKTLLDVFTDPDIVKVFHGSNYDVKWLQRDFDLYLVGLFDTGQAARVLQYPSASLAYVLSTLCEVSVDKSFQLADWRLRPLTPEMVRYARQDTRFLLEVFEIQRQSLLLKGKLEEVIEKSAAVASLCFQNPLRFEESAHEYVLKRNLKINGEPLKVFKKVYEWRDLSARRFDESPTFILSNELMLRVSREAPTSLTALRKVTDFPESFLEYDTLASDLVDSIKSCEVRRSFLKPETNCAKKAKLPLESEVETDGDWVDVTNFNFSTFFEDPEKLATLIVQRNKSSPFTKLARSMSKKKVLEEKVLRLEGAINVEEMLGENIVSSMTEVFRVSNKNRKRNKENKRNHQRSKAEKPLPMIVHRAEHLLFNSALETLQRREAKTLDSKTQSAQKFMSNLEWPLQDKKEDAWARNSPTLDVPTPAKTFNFSRSNGEQPKLGTFQEGEHILHRREQDRGNLSSSLYEPYSLSAYKTYKNTTRASLVNPTPLSSKPRLSNSQFKSHSYSDNAFGEPSFFERENNLQTYTGRLEHGQYNSRFDYEPPLLGHTLLPQYGNAFGESEPSPVSGIDHYLAPSGSSGNYISAMSSRHDSERMTASFERLPQTYNIDDVNSMLENRTDDITSFSYF